MMQPEVLHQPSSPFYSVMDSTLDQVEHYGLNLDAHVGGCDFSSSFTTTEDSSEISSIPYFSTMLSSDFVQFPGCDDDLVMFPVEDFSLDLEVFEPNLSDPLEGIYGFINESEVSVPSQQASFEGEDVWSPSPSIKSSSESSMDTTHTQSSLTLPGEDMEINNHLSVLHLLKACGEAMEKEQRELAEVILRCVSEKVRPFGAALERLAFNLSQDVQKQGGDYMKQESCKNFEAAFKAIYQIFPYGRFAHYAANSAILEAMPDDAETIHIVDFDMGEGVQWSLMIEAMARQQKAVKLTSIKWEEDYNCTPQWNFVETKKRLCDHARSFGLKLKVEEMKIDDLVCEIKKMKKRGGKREWLAFNCMVDLPHMGRERSRKLVKEFLQVAKQLLTNFANCTTNNNRGVITFGDGDARETMKDCLGFGSFFDECLVHYQALLESMESNFPIHLAEARMALETLFVAPYISSHAWLQKWEEMREGCNLQAGTGLEGWKVSKEVLMEAKEIVKDGGGLYGVRIGGQSENEMVLEWKGTPLMIISTWRNQS